MSAFFLLPVLAAGRALALELGGSYENDALVAARGDGRLVPGDLNKFRLKLDQDLPSDLAVHLEPRYYFLIRSDDLPTTSADRLDQVVFDRAYLRYDSPVLALTIGKQRIAWGSGYIWNPTDIFNPVVLSFAVREEDEANVEAVRLEVPLGQTGGLDGYLLTNASFSAAKKGLRAKTNVGLFDLSVSGVSLGQAGWQLGYDLAGELWGWGLRHEAAVRFPAGQASYLQAVFGCDYTLEDGLGLNAEYFFNGAGQSDQRHYDWTAILSGQTVQPGRDYLFLGINKNLDELTQVRLSAVLNLNDRSFLVYPALSRNIAEDVDLSFEAAFNRGDAGSEFCPGTWAGLNLMLRLIWSF